MTAPRQVLKGSTYLVTRRCTQRQFLLRPSKAVNDVFRFALAVAARRYGILVHAYCVMSNHYHLVVTDPGARLPDFHRDLDALVARALNAEHGRWEAFWKPGSYSAVRLVSPEDVVAKTAYTLANPVLNGLVRTGRLWPGLWSDPDRFCQSVEVPRPRGGFFSEKGTLPEKTTLELTVPAGFASPGEFMARVLAALAVEEKDAQDRIGRNFLGVRAVLKQKPTARPRSFEPRRGLNPRVAAVDKWKRIEALSRLKEFLVAYRRAWLARREGKRGVVFPAGTYLLRVAHGVACEAFG